MITQAKSAAPRAETNAGLSWALLAVLAAWMLLTRLPDLSQLVHLRDASMAVFFIAGLLAARAAGFCLLLALAVAIDVSVFARNDALHLCLSPAYAFLLPTYGLLWWSGRTLQGYAARHALPPIALLLAGLCVALPAISAAFLISNASFYLFSGAFDPLSWGGFASQFIRYAPSFVGTALAWSAVALLCVVVTRAVREGALAATPARQG